MSKKNSFLFAFFVSIAAFIFYSWNSVPAYTFDNDSARDLVEIHEILEGDIRLTGPNSSFGGLKTGPYYYYLFAPVLLFTKGSVEGFLYFNAFLFACATAFFFFTLCRTYQISYAITGTFAVIISPLFIFASRNPGNANTYLALLLVLFTLVHFYKLGVKNLLITGFLTGVIINFQYANVLVFIPLTVYVGIKLRNKKLILYYLIPFICTFIPLLLFELRHDFVMLKNTLFTDSYKGFIENTQLGTPHTQRNFMENIALISYTIGNVIGISPLFILPGLGIYIWKFQKARSDLLIYLFAAGVYLLTICFLQFQFADHYVFPAAMSILFMVIVIFVKENQMVLIAALIIFQVLLFPPIYDNSKRPYSFYKNVVEETIDSNILQNTESFNIIQIRPETSITPLGYEYRYFFILKGLKPEDIQNYNQSKQLLIFSRIPDFNPISLSSWEAKQFGTEYLTKSTKRNINGVDVYSILK